MENQVISYRFKFAYGREEVFRVKLDARTLELLPEKPENSSPWTRLDVHQCPNCSLDLQQHRYCPAALAIAPLVAGCGDIVSFDEAEIRVTTPERSVCKETTAQRGVSSLMGLLLATSGCPHTSFLKPMARFHLPFANAEETVFRATSMYLLGEYFSRQAGQPADQNLDGLKTRYERLNVVNKAMTARLRAAIRKDSTINALILLDLFAMDIPDAIEESLEKIRYLFHDG